MKKINLYIEYIDSSVIVFRINYGKEDIRVRVFHNLIITTSTQSQTKLKKIFNKYFDLHIRVSDFGYITIVNEQQMFLITLNGGFYNYFKVLLEI